MPRTPRGPRVMHLTAPGPVGGLESVVRSLALGHHRRGLDVHVATLLTPDANIAPFRAPLEEAGVPMHPLIHPARAYIRERAAVRRLLAAERPDVLHTHAQKVDILYSGIARRLGIATVTTIHGASRVSWRSKPYEWVQFRLARRFGAVVAVSRPLVDDLRRAGVSEDRIWLCPNAWDGRRDLLPRARARALLGLPDDAFVFGWVGRLIPIKGLDVFLEAFSKLRSPGPQVASVIGDGPEKVRLEHLSRSLGIDGKVAFHGRVDDASRCFSAFDAFVLSSRSEGTPIVLLEAMAAGTPIIATAVGGVPDVVSDAEADLVPPESPHELAAALRAAVEGTSNLGAKARSASRRLEEAFGTEQWLEKHEEIYQDALQREVRRSST